MRRLSRILSLVLLAVWFPVTQHCGLEAAGLIADHCGDNCTVGGTESDDNCSLVESGSFKSSAGAIKVRAPDLSVEAGVLSLDLPAPALLVEPVGGPIRTAGPPLDWLATWQFARRAAPPSRAPTFALA